MAAEYKHKRYFRVKKADNSYHTFVDLAEANTMVELQATWTGNNAVLTKALEDSNQTYVITIEHANESDQTAWKSAIDTTWADSTTISTDIQLKKGSMPNTQDCLLEHFKTEWFHADGSVSATTTLIS